MEMGRSKAGEARCVYMLQTAFSCRTFDVSLSARRTEQGTFRPVTCERVQRSRYKVWQVVNQQQMRSHTLTCQHVVGNVPNISRAVARCSIFIASYMDSLRTGPSAYLSSNMLSFWHSPSRLVTWGLRLQ